LPIQLLANLESFITLVQNWQNYAALSHGNLAVVMLTKIFSTVQDGAHRFKEKNTQNVLHHPPPFTYSVKLSLKLEDSFGS